MNKVIVILGPTGVGKTKMSVELAKKLNGEIINADSMQFYKGLNIGTAKIKAEEKEGIQHHLFDIKEVDEYYSIYNYQIDGRKVIGDILNRGKIPIVVGGTGLYIKALLYDYNLNYEKENNTYDELTTEEIYNKLLELDKDIIIDKNNRRRLIRAINYYKENKKSISDNKTNKLLYDAFFVGLTCDRDKLYNIINNRVDRMVEEGLIDEVKYYYDKKIYTKPLINGIGYKELYKYFDGEVSLETAIDKIKQNSRKYAKRQFTFFNHQLPVEWFNVDFDNFNNTIYDVLDKWKILENKK